MALFKKEAGFEKVFNLLVLADNKMVNLLFHEGE
jgi:hypothetical protein